VFTDNSAFLIERKFNASLNVGANTYPYVNGIVWEPTGYAGNTLSILSNRAGGVTLKGPLHNTLAFFLTRKIDNVNMDKGLPNRLDDTTETRLELVINLDGQAGYGSDNFKRLADHMNDKLLVIEPLTQQQLVTDKSLFTLGASTILGMNQSGELIDLDIIDIVHINDTDYLRVCNYHDYSVAVQQEITLA
jgi:hypothetical protein